MNPVITFLQPRRKKVSDIEFLAVKESQGKLRTNTNTRTTTGDGATLTAGASPDKDMYLARAVVTINTPNSTFNGSCTAELFVNGVVVDQTHYVVAGQISGGSGGIVTSFVYEFIRGLKVTTGQIIKIVITEDVVSIQAESTLVVFEEDPGVDPRI